MKAALSTLPVIDISPLFDRADSAARESVAGEIELACRASGFFYISGHNIPADLIDRLDRLSRQFFALPKDDKRQIAMAKSGRAWRGYFAVGDELTSGRPDIKEGVYFGTELPPEHPRVAAQWPLHGANLWPEQIPEWRETILDYIAATTKAAHALSEGVALSLKLAPDYFNHLYTNNPTILFRVFHYPAPNPAEADNWGVGEHSDYGFLTLLAQDGNGGLQVKTPGGWIDAPPIPGTLICNIGDMLDRLTGGFFRSTPHRVRNTSGRGRLSFPLFFDPDFAARVVPLPQHISDRADLVAHDRSQRWDGASVHAFDGTYGDYLIGKVSKVFPQLVGNIS